MSNLSNICPYTGLRSFTEEESLYFKGRDLQVDQITSLLEQNKFLMVTGASGEGKSSLIYAGLIPNARAGFFKAKYTNWVVADFRPERNPVHNMAEALARTFDNNTASVETELRRGFSSLIDLYTNSDYYIDESEQTWQQLGEPEKVKRKRKAANLMILVDQFEEFFTNPENFSREAPTQDSQVVVNLVLETARISIKRNIPVYIVCTMRSDYIGQCSAFRGLPEYIGFSQFFVPRLKRKDLKQVIEEPAILSGNRISQRLIERLVYDIAEGLDQLPILQHALSQVWLAADKGQQEMDLIHYAKVGGMPAHELPDEDQPVFRKWFDTLPPVRQKYYQSTGLNKVIEIHASVLYENAWSSYNKQHPDNPLTQQEAKRIIALTFSCLTKIDNSRAVRNRMTLGEITGIINSPACTPEVVSEVLGIYREEGNSFIRPFKTADPATHTISADTVLDITHESLIRNWNKLNTWANQEFEYYSTYLDFKKQLDRWKSSGKSNSFLLPIGPLTYFENWYSKCKPNEGWIKRYTEAENEGAAPAESADNILSGVQEFIKRSARKVAITRAFMKYGPQRIATLVAIILMLGLSAYYWYDAAQKQNSRVIKKVSKEISSLMKSKEVGWDLKSFPLLFMERYEKGFMQKFLSGLETRDRFRLTLETYSQQLVLDKSDSIATRTELINLANKDFSELTAKNPDYVFLLPELNKFTTLLAYDHYYNPVPATENVLVDMADEGYRVSLALLRNRSLFKNSIPPELNYSLQQWLTFGRVTPEKTDSLLRLFSPFESSEGKVLFDVYYPKGRKEPNGQITNDYFGGYHSLASLYAVRGDTTRINQCFDSIRQSGGHDYFTALTFNNPTNILALLYQFGHREKTGNPVKWISARYPSETALAIYKNAVNRSGYISNVYETNLFRYGGAFTGYLFPNLYFASRDIFQALVDDYEKLIGQVNDPSERNYLLAINKKRRAIFVHKYHFDRGIPADTVSLNRWLGEALEHYRQVDKNYLGEKVPVILSYRSDGVRNLTFTRKHLFIYPDYMDGWYSGYYHSDLFFKFIDSRNLYNELYSTAEDWGYIHLWLARALQQRPFPNEEAFYNRYPLTSETLVRILSLSDSHPLDKNLLCLVLANSAFNRGDTVAAMDYYRKFDRDNFAGSRDKYEYLEKTYFLNQLRDICANLAQYGHQREAVEMAEKFVMDYEKVFTYVYMAERMYNQKADPVSFVYLDSALSKNREVDSSRVDLTTLQGRDYREHLVLLLSRIGGRPLNAIAAKMVAGFEEGFKFNVIVSRVEGVAAEGNFYRARQAIPSMLTEQEDLISRVIILWQACVKRESIAEKNKWKKIDQFLEYSRNYINFQPF
jgi:energy-coupling factor transporter ATP-binding protein EcfA2